MEEIKNLIALLDKAAGLAVMSRQDHVAVANATNKLNQFIDALIAEKSKQDQIKSVDELEEVA